jgi:ribosomal-protein-alanine N-acetyltransferase
MVDMPPHLETERLILRRWCSNDAEAFAAMNADPEVMRYFRVQPNRRQSDAMLERVREKWRQDGVSFWAVELKGTGNAHTGLIGFCGLNWPTFPTHLGPCVEVGWRLARHTWGKGYATEAARASLAHGFGAMRLAEVVAFSVADNWRSRAVMERLGMTRNPDDDFNDPDEAVDSPLRRLVLYRLCREEWPG